MAPAGFAKGPKILNTVRTPSSRRTGAACFIELWYTGANIKHISISFNTSSFCDPFNSRAPPNSSITSAAPHLLDTLRLPCFATGMPAAEITKPAVVEILNVLAPSPPVPTISSTSFLCRTAPAFSRITSAKAVISSTVSPFNANAVRKPPIWIGATSPFIILFIVSLATSKDKS